MLLSIRQNKYIIYFLMFIKDLFIQEIQSRDIDLRLVYENGILKYRIICVDELNKWE